jgi:hypothetical protein
MGSPAALADDRQNTHPSISHVFQLLIAGCRSGTFFGVADLPDLGARNHLVDD